MAAAVHGALPRFSDQLLGGRHDGRERVDHRQPHVHGLRTEHPRLNPLDGPPVPGDNIAEFGLYIYAKLDGPFKLQLDRVAAYGAPASE